jgi:hypothetical protein
MICTPVRRRLLASERPDRPAAPLARHVASCPACREWLRGLVSLERQVASLPAPSSSAKERLLQQFRVPGRLSPASLNVVVRPSFMATPPKERGLRKTALAVALAAAVVLLAVGLALLPLKPSDRTETLNVDAARSHHDVLRERLALVMSADTANQRVRGLTELTRDLHKQAMPLARNAVGQDLNAVATMFAEVVNKEMPAQVRMLDRDDRPDAVRQMTDELIVFSSEIDRFLAEGNVADAARSSLEEIKTAAIRGRTQLRDLLAEG